MARLHVARLRENHRPRQAGISDPAPQFAIDEVANTSGGQAKRHQRCDEINHIEPVEVLFARPQAKGNQNAEKPAMKSHATFPYGKDFQRVRKVITGLIKNDLPESPAEDDAEHAVEEQVIKLLNDLQAKLGFAMIFVSHDLALVAEVAHNITVMYAGQVIEQAPTKELLTNPIHEYTRGLLGSVLSIESGSGRLHQVPGAVPSPRDFPKGDRFAPRSSHPRIGLDTRPVFKRVPGTEHFYSELPDEVLKANGLTPHAEVM